MDNNVKEIIKVELEIVLTNDDIDNIMCTALESAISYWCENVVMVDKCLGKYASNQISKGGKLILRLIEPFDSDNTECYELDLERFKNGVKQWAQSPVGSNCLRQIDGKLRLDTDYTDEIVCDAIIQYSLFGEIVFG